MLPIRAFTVPAASLILSFRTISFTQRLVPLIDYWTPPEKSPGNAFVQFVKVKYHEIETGDNPKERIKELKRIWESMSPDGQQPYEIMYRVKKIHYIEDQEKVFANYLPEEFEESIKMYKEIREKAAAKTNEIYTGYDPPDEKLNGECLFVREELNRMQVINRDDKPSYNQKYSEAVAKWKKMCDDKKKPYDDEAELIKRSHFLNYCINNPEYLLEVEKGIAKKNKP